MDLDTLYSAVIDGDAGAAVAETQRALEADVPVEVILKEGLIPAMEEVGRRFEEYEYFLPEMLASAQAMKASLVLLQPLLAARDVKPIGRAVLGTVQGDMHDIGKNLVGMMLEGGGFEIVDLGADVPAEKFVEAAAGTQVIGLSALLTTTMPVMGQVIQALEEAGVRDQVKVIVGGAPVTQAFADQIGADGYGPDASSAVRKAKELLDLQ
jgi:5-methyltetrahydrofolate--homocysteine methyltransferase